MSSRADPKIVDEIQTLYRMGVHCSKLYQHYSQHCSIYQVRRICRRLPRDLRENRILKMWSDGSTCNEIVSTTGLSISTVRSTTKGITGGWKDTIFHCNYCGKEFEQRRFKNGSFCRRECKRRAIVKKLSLKKFKRYEEMCRLRSEGMTYQSIANQYNLSRQRVHAIVHLDREDV